MTTTLETSYQPLQPFGPEIGEGDETPQETGVMIHVVPESGRARWNHVEDLDSFFARTYRYHQKHGFTCMMLQESLELFQFIFVVVFSTFLFNCVNYPILFRDSIVNATQPHKVTLSDAIIPCHECIGNLGGITWICIVVAFVFWLLRAIKVVYHLFQFWDIKAFFNTALKINDHDLDNLTWHEVQRRVRDVQREQQMCIHKRDLSELDIYHRILRFKNYMVAMVNKSLIPVRLRLPIIGEAVFMTRGLKYNIELLLFWGPWAPFENNWHLKEDYKKSAKRQELARNLSKHILWVGIANFILCPLILLWQILYSFFNYGEMIKREPGSLGSRAWSPYGRLYLRHFNELDHELNARLNRAYRPASKYMNIFTSPIMTVIATNVAFVAGACFGVLVILSVYDEDVLTVEHVLTAITVCGAIVAACKVFIPDENLVWCPEKLMTAVLAHVHYLPDSWRGQAHTHRVRAEFSELFQYKAVYLIEELLSPVVTPFVLCFHVRSRALDIVDFYRNFTVEVVGVGDVCSFAQMDVRRHGNPTWQQTSSGHGAPAEPPASPAAAPPANQYTQAEDGKTELSLVHFTMTNPEWRAPAEAETFVTALRTRARRDAAELPHLMAASEYNPLFSSLNSMSSIGGGYSSLVASILRGAGQHGVDTSMAGLGGLGYLGGFGASTGGSMLQTQPPAEPPAAVRGGLSRAEGPLHSDKSLINTLYQSSNPFLGRGPESSLGASLFGPGLDLAPDTDPIELTAADMSLSTLYLHELHHRQIRRRGYQESSQSRSLWQRPHHDMPHIREVGDEAGETSRPAAGGDPTRLAERTPLLDATARPPRPS